ncbi:hypothetical protein [Winogradskyella ouciana]|uniref:hypothetical protein n=1 Tax=Winogradskyella ouciana TaxID=2608631 RepID=UPI001F3CEE73|nr:hypothetical protein [Winogradskyella ouciana]
MRNKTVDLDFAKRLYTQPEKFIDSFDFKYATDKKLNIVRESRKGEITYSKNGKSVTQKATLKRIKELTIPPAWENLNTASNKIAHI